MPLSLNGFEDNSVITRAEMNAESPFFLSISMTFLPDNRMLLLSKDGEILIVDPESGRSESYMKLQNIDTGQERGLLDIVLDPDFANNGYFYVYYTPDFPERATISRFTHDENSGGLTSEGNLSSEFVVWQDTDTYLSCCHYGGGLDFGPDGKLWLTTSDKFEATTPGEGAAGGDDIVLDPASSSGKVIRVNTDGTAPDGTDGWAANPYVEPGDIGNDFVWAYGLRNPFRAHWDHEYGYFYIAEVGGNQQNLAHDDLHVASLNQPDVFYGWPYYEGTPNNYVNDNQSNYDLNDFPAFDGDIGDPTNGDFYSAPIFSIDHADPNATPTGSVSLTGGEIYRGDMFPEEWDGVYFYGDYTNDYIRYLVLAEDGITVLDQGEFKPSAELPGKTNEVVSINVGEDGALYYAMIASGEVRRVTFGDNDAPVIASATITPATDGPLPLQITFDATVSDPDGDTMTYLINFGDGTTANGTVVGGTISVTHTYTVDGRYDVSLTVFDQDTLTHSDAFEVQAGDVNDPPVITENGVDANIIASGDTVQFTATVTDPEDDALTYIWHFGDGTTATGAVPASGEISVLHTYTIEGSFNSFLELSDGSNTVFSADTTVRVGESDEVPVTNGLVLLLQSDIKIGLQQGDTVGAWLDGSGNGNNLFAQGDPQLTQGLTPTGEAAIVFDGIDDALVRDNTTDTIFNLPAGGDDRTIFFVVDYVDPERTSSGVAYGDAEANQTFGLVADKTFDLAVQGYGSSNDFDSGVDGVTGGFMVQSVVLNSNVLSHYQDGTLIDSANHTFNTDVQKLILGAEIGGAGESDLKIAAVLIYDRALSEGERGLVEGFLQTKYIGGSTGGGNQDPVAVNDSYTTDEDTALVVDAATGVLDNDADPDIDPLTAAEVTGPSNGTLTLNADGSFTYTPNTGFTGTDSFTYEADDGQGGTDTATVTINVEGDTPPPAGEVPVQGGLVGSYSADENTTLGTGNTVAGWLDGSGNGNDLLSQGDPQLEVNSTPTGRESIVFDGAGDLLERVNATDSLINFPSGNQDRTLFFVVDYVDPEGVSAGLAFGDAAQNETFGLVADRRGELDVQGYGRDNDIDTNVDGVQGGFFVQSVVLSGDVLNHYKDGALIDTDTHTFATDLQKLVIGAEIGGLGEAQMKVASVLIYNRALNETERQQVETYLQEKFITGPTGSNNVPNAINDAYTTDEDTPLVINIANGVLANDTDPDFDPLSASEVTGPSNGTLTLNADGSFTYTPNAGFFGQDTFTYEASDGQGGVDNATVILTVNEDVPGNTAPVAVADAYTTDEDQALVIDALAGVLANDSDVDLDPLSASEVTGPSNGTLTLNADGSFTYTPNAGFFGQDSFTYEVSDGQGGTDQETVTITVNEDVPGNTAPVAVADAYTTDEDQALVIDALAGVLANDSDVDLDPLSAAEVTGPSNGTLSLNADGSFTYTPNAGFFGQDSFTYEVSDGQGGTDQETVTITVDEVPDNTAPVAVADAYSTDEDQALVIDALAGVLANDSDVDLDPLSAAEVTGPSNGTLALSADGSFTYTPNSGFSGQDSFTYEVSDGQGGTDQETVTITVNAAPPPSGNPVTAGLVASFESDSNVGTNGSTVTGWQDGSGQGNDLTALDDPQLVADATPTGEAAVAFDGTGDLLQRVGGLSGLPDGNADRTVFFVVDYINMEGVSSGVAYGDAAQNETFGLVTDRTGDLEVQGYGSKNDIDSNVDGIPGGFMVQSVVLSGDVLNHYKDGALIDTDTHVFATDLQKLVLGAEIGGLGESQLQIAGVLIYDRALGETERQDVEAYLQDKYITGSVGGGNTAPDAVADAYSTDEDQALVIDSLAGVLSNDTDPDLDALSAAEVTGPSNGSLTLNADGSFTYTPNAGFFGQDSFTYEAADGNGGTDQATVTLTVNEVGPSNGAPSAVADAYSTDEDQALVIDALAGVLSNDTDPDTDPLSAAEVTGPSNGSLTLNADGSFSYTPNAGFFGQDSFIYEASDGNGGTDQATVTLTVNEVNLAPTATADSYNADQDTALVIDALAGVLSNDTDPDLDALSAAEVTGPSNGSLTLNADGSFTYTPNAGFFGQDSFIYEASDGNGGTDQATVTLDVAPTPTVPVSAGLVADFRTGQGTVDTNGSTVTGWQDGSGQGNVLMALGDPQLVQGATPTGQAAIVFDGTDDLLQRTDTLNGLVDGSGDRTMFFVVDYIDPDRTYAGVSYGDAELNETFGLMVDRSGDLEVQGYGSANDLDSNVDGVNGGFLVQSVVVDDDLVEHYLNGSLIDSDTHVYATDLQKLVVGAEIGGAGEAEMQVASVLIYDRALDETERADVETYLQELYIDDQFIF